MKTEKEGTVGIEAALGTLARGSASPASAVGAMMLVAAAFAVLELTGEHFAPDDHPLSPDITLVLSGVTTAVTLMFGGLLASLPPVSRRPTGLYLGLGVILLATLSVAVGELGATLVSGSWASLNSVRSWSLVLVFTLLALGAAAPDRPGFGHTFPGWAGLTATVLVASSQLGFGIPFALEAAWALVVLAQLLAFVNTEESRHIWVAVALLSFLLAEVELAAGVSTGLLGVHVVRVMGVSLAGAGLILDMAARTRAQRALLAVSRDRVRDLQHATNEARRTLEERDHEARSALAAIEFTAYALRRHAETLDGAALQQLEIAFTSELALLRRLLTLPDTATTVTPYQLRDAVSGVAAYARARGAHIDIDVAPDLVVSGSPDAVAEIAQIVLDNARIHAPGSAVRIWARRAGAYVVTTFDDHGPGIPPAQRMEVFLRGRDAGHATSVHGRGLGLYLAQRLAGEQSGKLWVDESPSGGASIRLALPAAPIEVAEFRPVAS